MAKKKKGSSPLVGVPRFKRKYAYLTMGILLCVRVIVVYSYTPDLPWQTMATIVGGAMVYFVTLWEYMAWLDKTLERRVYPYERSPGARFLLQNGCTLVYVIPIHYGYVWLAKQVLVNTIYWPNIEPFFLNVALVGISILLAITLNLGYFGKYFFQRWRHALVEQERLAKEKAQMEREWSQLQFNNLRNQFNPHFFFNSITSLSSLIHENQELASAFLQQLAKVYRYILRHRDHALVPLAEELGFANHYLNLLETRFGNSLQIIERVSQSPNLQRYSLVPVTVQLLVENAIKHNQMTDEEPLRIELWEEEGLLLVQNNVQLKRIMGHSNRMGLDNLRKLYGHLTQRPLAVEEAGGQFTVKVPLIEE